VRGDIFRLRKLIDVVIWHSLNAHDEFFVSLDGFDYGGSKIEKSGCTPTRNG